MAQDHSEYLRAQAIDDLSVDTLMQLVRLPLCVTDPSRADNPIIYVNEAFLELTGYTRDEAIGRNCRFLQGPETDADAIATVRSAIADSRSVVIDILNYRKDGSQFINSLQIAPVVDDEGQTLLFFGSQLDVTEKRAEESRVRELANAELLHRLRNIVNVMDVMIRTTSDELTDREQFVETVIGRLHALSDAHFQSLRGGQARAVEVVSLTRTIVEAYVPGTASRIKLEGPALRASSTSTTPLALVLHELATNAVKHGALCDPDGELDICWLGDEGRRLLTMIWKERGGPPVEKPDRMSGSKIIATILDRIGGRIDYDWEREGLTATVCVPAAG